MALDNNTVVNYTDKTTIKNWFKTGLKPTQAQFWATWDSYWHKSEKLPISSISGLGNLLDGKAEENHEHNQYAKNDATSLTADNVTAWQQKLGVADLKFDDKAITTTQDYADFGLVAGDSINAFNNAVYEAITGGEFGKNFSNTDLEITENRKHTGTAIVELAMPMIYSNASQRFSGLVDKSADATYVALLGIDNQGNAGKLTALGNVLESGLQTISSTQALRIGQLLNGGRGSSGTMSVNLISPPIIQNRFDSVEYVLLRGSNLYLDNTNYAIEILDENKTNVVATIPQNQVQLYANGTQLIFYYNFYQFLEGRCFIRLTSGSKVLITTLDLNIVQQVEDINTEDTTWEVLYDESITPSPDDVLQGSNVIITTPIGVSSIPKIAIKSSQIFAQGEDFYLEMSINLGSKNLGGADASRSYIGVGYSNVNNTLINNTLVNFNYSWQYNASIAINNNTTQVGIYSSPYDVTIVLIKTGNLFRMIVGNTNYSTTLSNNSGYSVFMSFVGRGVNQTITTKITKAFKFN